MIMKKIFSVLAVALIFVMVGCSTQNNAKLDGEWLITNACGVNTQGGDSDAFINFDGNGKVNGNATVNTFFGSYTTSGNTLTFGTMGMTRMMGGSMKMEDAITDALNNTATWEVNNDEATIFNKEGKPVMTLKRKK